MRRREFIALLGGVAATWQLAARAQQGEQVRRIGILLALRIIFGIVGWLAADLMPGTKLAAEPLPRSVLIFDQSELNAPWGIEFRAALRATLSANPATPVVIYSEVLDFSRFHTREYEEMLRTFLRTKYRDKPIGVIIAHGSLALDILMRLRVELWSNVPVVFGAVDQPTVARLNLPSDVTGTIMQLRLGNSIDAAKVLVPNLRRVVHVGDPFERQAFRRHYAQELTQYTKEFEIIDLSGLPMAQLRSRVAALPNNSAIIYTSIYVDDAGMTYIPRDALVHVAETANRPIVGEAETLIGHGVTGGFVAVPEPVGQTTAQLALRILGGEKASDIPISTGNFTKPIFDWRQLQRWGISVASLPPGSEVRFRPATMWEQYSSQLMIIFAAFVIQTALICWLIVEHRRRHVAEIKARRAMSDLSQMNRIAGSGQLSASIAHEVNQPLGAISASASAAMNWLRARTPNIDEALTSLTLIKNESHRAGDIVSNLRAMFRKDVQQSGPVEINKIILSVLQLVRIELAEQNIEVRTQLGDGLPIVTGNEIQLQQVVLNLIINAKDAMQSTSSHRELLVRSEQSEPGWVQVSVEDTGPGISPPDLERIFQPMVTTKSQGMGMGLSICRSIMEAHSGRIVVASGRQTGAAFQFSLPASATKAELSS